MNAATPSSVHWIDHGDDPFRVAAELLCGTDRPADLSDRVILLPDLLFAPRLRQALTDTAAANGHRALLGPTIQTLDGWLNGQRPLGTPVLSRAARELVLVEALGPHRHLFGDDDPWRVSEQLLDLFDELTRHQVPVDGPLAAFQARLEQAYGTAGKVPAPLGDEARIIHQLWQAWRTQLADDGVFDAASAHLQRLQQAPDTDTRFLLIGQPGLSRAELAWVRQRLEAGRLQWIIRGYPGPEGYHPEAPATLLARALEQAPEERLPGDPVSACLGRVFDIAAAPLPDRIADQRAAGPDSPLGGTITSLATDSAEQEALAIDLQVRRWLLAGRRTIGVVTEDRRLARRVRALLERAGVNLEDSGGWALSTTSAAAAIERWLETLEEDFAHQPLLDVLKSPFICTSEERDGHLATVYRLEQDIVLHEQIGRGLERYRDHLEYRMRRLPPWSEAAALELRELLNRLDRAADPLRSVAAGATLPAAEVLERMRDSLMELGMWDTLQNDAAGQRILQEWEGLHAAARHSPLTLDWDGFRVWFGRTLERYNFQPPGPRSGVQLLTLRQAELGRFDALVIGACDRESLPSGSGTSPFFNQRVRHELGLPNQQDDLALQLHRFRGLLQSAPRVLLSWRREDNGEPRLPSPWLELLETFHRNAYGHGLEDGELAALLGRPGTRVKEPEPWALPVPMEHPAAVLPGERIPDSLSASAHQRLIDCPYRFFAADGLGLKPPEAIREALAKSDYGERVHKCLEAFHGDVKGLPGPFGQPVCPANRDAALRLLEVISTAVFAKDLEDNFLHRAWLQRWWQLIPAYIDWQTDRQVQWQVAAVEQQGEQPLNAGVKLMGRLDRLDRNDTGLGIIDYKTGRAPDQQAVDEGEAVQLPTYAAVSDALVSRVEYLLLDQNRVKTGAFLEADALGQQQAAVTGRLAELLAAIADGTPLPAWGDSDTCNFCELDGICRRQAWLDDPEAETK